MDAAPGVAPASGWFLLLLAGTPRSGAGEDRRGDTAGYSRPGKSVPEQGPLETQFRHSLYSQVMVLPI